MVRLGRALLKDASVIPKALSDLLVCPLSKQPVRQCAVSQSLISDGLGVSYPVVDGIPCLVPKDGKLLDDEKSKCGDAADSSLVNKEC